MNVICSTKLHDSPGDCGTAACAIGNLRNFNPVRFDYQFYFDDTHEKISYFHIVDRVSRETNYINIAVDYFGLDFDQAEQAFDPISYNAKDKTKIHPKTVAKVLRSFLKKD